MSGFGAGTYDGGHGELDEEHQKEGKVVNSW